LESVLIEDDEEWDDSGDIQMMIERASSAKEDNIDYLHGQE
jgi:hypothetical protein